jgi:hypothetical protein
MYLSMQDVADIRKQFPLLEGDIKFPKFFREEQFFSSVFRISSPGLQLWTHYDVCCVYVDLTLAFVDLAFVVSTL